MGRLRVGSTEWAVRGFGDGFAVGCKLESRADGD